MYSDYHVHSNFSFDSEENPENIVSTAIHLGMSQICITDHQDYNWPIPTESPQIDIQKYSSTIQALQKKYSSKIQLIKGIEIGLAIDNVKENSDFINNGHFEFVIGSCHIVDNMDPYYSDFWNNRKDRDAFELYFKTLLSNLKLFNNIDSLGHLDYVVRYSPNRDANYSVLDYQDMIDEILKLIIDKNIKLEINTSNLAKGFDFANPHTDIIERYSQLGGQYITVGSDAHKANQIGYGFDYVKKLVKQYNLKVFTV